MYAKNRQKLIVPMLLPAMLLLVVFFYWPAVNTVWVSFTDWSGVLKSGNFAGFANYHALFNDSFFLLAVRNTGMFFLIACIIMFPLTLFLAVALRKIPVGGGTFRFTVFAPVVLSVVVAAVVWKFLLNPEIGLFNELLRLAGLESLTRAWLGEPSIALVAVVLASIWHGIGTWVILVMAGMDRIPTELYDASVIDGANEWQSFRHVTFPLLGEVLRSLLILSFVQAMQAFSFIYIMTRGGPQGKTEVMGSYLYKMAFEGQEFAYGAALSVFMVVIIIVISAVGSRLFKRDTSQY
ncbi:carbohydrate ABC transporter permease [Paenibacillus solisilvae]|uniref:Carbohydrate ABC transporter permease n=1 Tax=Paenibacillus solisilvae TaxID=2486751 RepID=A0ABW0VZA9_9BACL